MDLSIDAAMAAVLAAGLTGLFNFLLTRRTLNQQKELELVRIETASKQKIMDSLHENQTQLLRDLHGALVEVYGKARAYTSIVGDPEQTAKIGKDFMISAMGVAATFERDKIMLDKDLCSKVDVFLLKLWKHANQFQYRVANREDILDETLESWQRIAKELAGPMQELLDELRTEFRMHLGV